MVSHAEKYELLVKNQHIESCGFNLKLPEAEPTPSKQTPESPTAMDGQDLELKSLLERGLR